MVNHRQLCQEGFKILLADRLQAGVRIGTGKLFTRHPPHAFASPFELIAMQLPAMLFNLFSFVNHLPALSVMPS